MVKKILKIIMFIRFDVINERNPWQTDSQKLRDSKDRAYASHCTVKMNIKIVENKLWKRLSINNEKLSIS